MNTKLLASLEFTLEKWVEKCVELDEWPDAIWSKNLIAFMARAAEAVIDSAAEQHEETNND